MVSNDPDFETKAADVIGLYLNPPAHAAVFCVDEKTAIQALDRKDRMLPLSPGRAESHGFEYKRNGTLSLFAALNTATGEVLGKTAARHTSEQFVAFLQDMLASQPERREIHVICDNVSSHKTELVAGLPGRASARPDPLHADLFVVAQPGRELVLAHPARRHQPRHLHLGQGPRQEAHALHPCSTTKTPNRSSGSTTIPIVDTANSSLSLIAPRTDLGCSVVLWPSNSVARPMVVPDPTR